MITARRAFAALLATALSVQRALAQAVETSPAQFSSPTQPMPPGGWPGAPNDPWFYPRIGLAVVAVALAYSLVTRVAGWRFPKELRERASGENTPQPPNPAA